VGHRGTPGRVRQGEAVKAHINHVFMKLRLGDRAAAVAYAFGHDLVRAAADARGAAGRRG
jgi:hypothetical protein